MGATAMKRDDLHVQAAAPTLQVTRVAKTFPDYFAALAAITER